MGQERKVLYERIPCFNRQVLTTLTDQTTSQLGQLDSLLEQLDQISMESPTPTQSSGTTAHTPNNRSLDNLELDLVKSINSKMTNDEGLLKAFLTNLNSDNDVQDEEQNKDLLSRIFLGICEKGNLEVIDLLLESNKIDLDHSNDINGKTCLHFLSAAGRLDVLELIFMKKQKPNPLTVDVYGRLPLHYASMFGHFLVVEFFLTLPDQDQKTIDSMDNEGSNPLVYAIVGDHQKTAEVLIERGASVEPIGQFGVIPLCLASQYRRTDIARFLLQKGASVDVANSDGLRPLHLTAREGNLKLAKLLIQHNAKVDTRDSFHSWTPLFYAASEGHLEIVKALLAAGANVNSKDDFEWVPWTYALYRGHAKVAELLVVDGMMEFSLDDGEIEKDKAEVKNVDFDVDGGLKKKKKGKAVVMEMQPVGPMALFGESESKIVKELEHREDLEIGDDVDDIPSLSLPPPIIPGHNYLEKKYYIQITFEKKKATSLEKIFIKSPPSFVHGSNLSTSQQNLAQANLLSQRKSIAEFGGIIQNTPVSLFSSNKLSSLQLIISSKPEVGIPYTVNLPFTESDLKTYSFLVEEKDILSTLIQFDIFPTFGTKALGSGVALPQMYLNGIRSPPTQTSTSSTTPTTKKPHTNFDSRKCTAPLIDINLKVVGDVNFECLVVSPFEHSCLTIGGKVETYWKSISNNNRTTSIPRQNSFNHNNQASSLITDTSLANLYWEIQVGCTAEGIPVILPSFWVDIGGGGEKGEECFSASSFSLKQVRRLLGLEGGRGRLEEGLRRGESNDEVSRLIGESGVTLEEAFEILPSGIGLSISILYPSKSETDHYSPSKQTITKTSLNEFLDAILKVVYDQALKSLDGGKSIIFSSLNPKVCTMLNWKQPNYGVFFRTNAGFGLGYVEDDKVCSSIKEAIKFCRGDNLLGMICQAKPLVQVPELIKTVKESGLILGTFGDDNLVSKNKVLQERFGVDAIISRGVLRYNHQE